MKFNRLLGVSPEIGEEEIKKICLEVVGIGEVVEIKKVWLHSRTLPGVTNGTWALRVKILDQDRVIPSYIFTGGMKGNCGHSIGQGFLLLEVWG